MSAFLDFNKTTTKEAKASEAINDLIAAGLRRQQDKQERRAYVGASVIGKACERALQFDLAGTPREKSFKTETLRKFAFGHSIEEVSRQHFWQAGFDLAQKSQKTGALFRFTQLDDRFAGTPDGVFVGGPDVPGVGYPCLWETKSTGAKTYREIEKQGLKKARPTYYAQCQIYMAYLGLTDHPCIFTVTNLDTGEQLHLLVSFDAEAAQALTDKAVRIVSSTDAGELLPRPFAARDHMECRWCDFAERCWSLPA